MREFFHQPFDDVTERHMIERRARRSADHNRIDIEALAALAKASAALCDTAEIGTISI